MTKDSSTSDPCKKNVFQQTVMDGGISRVLSLDGIEWRGAKGRGKDEPCTAWPVQLIHSSLLFPTFSAHPLKLSPQLSQIWSKVTKQTKKLKQCSP